MDHSPLSLFFLVVHPILKNHPLNTMTLLPMKALFAFAFFLAFFILTLSLEGAGVAGGVQQAATPWIYTTAVFLFVFFPWNL